MRCDGRLFHLTYPFKGLPAGSPLSLRKRVHLLYLDESGTAAHTNQRFFVLAGFSIFERQTHWMDAAITDIAEWFDAINPSSIEFHGAPMRGIVIFDKSHYEQRIQNLSYLFKHVGHSAGKLRNFSEVPLFLDSKASRLIQLADLIAYWTFRRYEAHDDRGYRLLAPYFHAYGGKAHGLCELLAEETKDALARIPEPTYPFPPPTPFAPTT